MLLSVVSQCIYYISSNEYILSASIRHRHCPSFDAVLLIWLNCRSRNSHVLTYNFSFFVLKTAIECLRVGCHFEPCKPQRITSGLKQTSIHLLFTLHTNFPSTTKSVLTQIYKQNVCTHTIFQEFVPSVLPPLKQHTRLGHAGIADHSVNLKIPDFKIV